jgi:hypothetical protein
MRAKSLPELVRMADRLCLHPKAGQPQPRS